MGEFIRSAESGRWYEADGADVTDWMAEDDALGRGDGGYWDAVDDGTARWWCEFSHLEEERENAGRPWTWGPDATAAKDEMQAGRTPRYATGIRLGEYGPAAPAAPEGDGDPRVACLDSWE